MHSRYGGAENAVRDIVARLIDEESVAAARRTGLALRLAFTLCGGVPSLLSRATLAVERGNLVLRVPARGPLQGGETVERRLTALSRALGLEPRLRHGGVSRVRNRGRRT